MSGVHASELLRAFQKRTPDAWEVQNELKMRELPRKIPRSGSSNLLGVVSQRDNACAQALDAGALMKSSWRNPERFFSAMADKEDMSPSVCLILRVPAPTRHASLSLSPSKLLIQRLGVGTSHLLSSANRAATDGSSSVTRPIGTKFGDYKSEIGRGKGSFVTHLA